MDYKEKYEQALERAQKMQENSNGMILKKWLFGVFPELKESEDERIRKAILQFFELQDDNTTYFLVPKKDIIAWLEKQNPVWSEEDEGMLKWLCRIIHTQRLDRAITLKEESELGEWMDKWLNHNPQPKQCEHLENYDEDERVRKWLEELIEAMPDNSIEFKELKRIDVLHWLEKQSEDKHTDKVEPKFKVGDWITNGDYIWKIVEVTPLDYILQSQDGNIVDDTISYVDKHFHLWTIEDAKDGDVLVNWNNTTFIFKAIEDEAVKYHIAYNEKWDTIKTPSTKLSHLGLPEPEFGFHPAAKEQRNLLFQKMKEEGYEWDADRKELKKIEPKKLDANKVINWVNPDKVIEWLKGTIRETKEYLGEYGQYYDSHLTLPYSSIEDLINDFKEDFRL